MSSEINIPTSSIYISPRLWTKSILKAQAQNEFVAAEKLKLVPTFLKGKGLKQTLKNQQNQKRLSSLGFYFGEMTQNISKQAAAALKSEQRLFESLQNTLKNQSQSLGNVLQKMAKKPQESFTEALETAKSAILIQFKKTRETALKTIQSIQKRVQKVFQKQIAAVEKILSALKKLNMTQKILRYAAAISSPLISLAAPGILATVFLKTTALSQSLLSCFLPAVFNSLYALATTKISESASQNLAHKIEQDKNIQKNLQQDISQNGRDQNFWRKMEQREEKILGRMSD